MRNPRHVWAVLAAAISLGLAGVSDAGTAPAPDAAAAGGGMCASTNVAWLAPLAPSGRPESALWLLIGMFEQLNPQGYVTPMTADFRFDSADPAFRAASPGGMSRDDELAFATHLFKGGKHAPDGSLLPRVVRVIETLGPMRVHVLGIDGGFATARIEHLLLELVFEDGSHADLGTTDNTFELALGESGWRVRRWHETQACGEPDAGVAQRDSASGGAGASLAGARTLAPPVPARLELAAHAEPGSGRMRFDVSLPRAGGALELFDVMGRRMAGRDLEGLAAGAHTIAIEAGAIPAGFYWARVRQGGDAVTTRLAWIR